GDPVQVGVGLLDAADDARRVSACVRTDTGNVICWGHPQDLGDSQSETFLPTQMKVDGVPVVARDLSAGLHVYCAARATAPTVCWGAGSQGRLGIGSVENKPYPPQAVKPDEPDAAFAEVSGAADHTCAVQADAAVNCWGPNTFNQFGFVPYK